MSEWRNFVSGSAPENTCGLFINHEFSVRNIMILSPQAPLERPKSSPGGLLGVSWTPLSSRRPLEALLEASGNAPGGLLDRNKLLLNGSWALQEKFQDRFQPKGVWRIEGGAPLRTSPPSSFGGFGRPGAKKNTENYRSGGLSAHAAIFVVP